jgi:NADH-quinone oxidoreductase subunit N
VLDVMLPRNRKRVVGWVSLAGLGFAFISLWILYTGIVTKGAPRTAFFDMIVLDSYAVVFKSMFLIGAALSILLSMKYLDVEGEQRGEYYALILFSVVGMMFMASGVDLLTLFISLELMAVSVYILVGYFRRDQKSNEASMKYFLLGAFSTGVLLYGISMVYGLTGSTNLAAIAEALPKVMTVEVIKGAGGDTIVDQRYLLLMAMILMAAGMFFKVAAVPFHMWAPDAYEGAPTSVTAFLSTGSKAASFALYARIFVEALPSMRADWAPLLGLVAAITIMVGNWAAVTQENSKRLLAYSSISNAGYLLLGLVAGNTYGYVGLTIYLLVYTLMNMGAFGIVISLRRRGIIGDNVNDMTGLAQKAPAMAAMMTIFMLSLGGLPMTGGFIGKYFLFGGLLQRGAADGKSWYYWLAGWAIINTVVSFYYYVRFIKVMYLGDRMADDQPLSLSPALQTALVASLLGIIFIGVYPQPLIDVVQRLIGQ